MTEGVFVKFIDIDSNQKSDITSVMMSTLPRVGDFVHLRNFMSGEEFSGTVIYLAWYIADFSDADSRTTVKMHIRRWLDE